jgi:hypothetical protein
VVDGGIVDTQLPGLGPQVQRIARTAAFEAMEDMFVEIGRESAAGAGCRAMERARAALLSAARAVGVEAARLCLFVH